MKHLLKSASLALLLLFGMTTAAKAQGNYRFFAGSFTPATGSRTLPFKSFFLWLNADNGQVSGYLSTQRPGGGRNTSNSTWFSGEANRRGVFTGSFSFGPTSYTLTGSFNRQSGTVVASVKQRGSSRARGHLVGKEERNNYP